MIRKFPNTQKLYNRHLNNSMIKNEITIKFRKYFNLKSKVPTKQEGYNKVGNT